jgi:hypothetical protein
MEYRHEAQRTPGRIHTGINCARDENSVLESPPPLRPPQAQRLNASTVLALQRSAGNSAVQRLLRPTHVQGPPGPDLVGDCQSNAHEHADRARTSLSLQRQSDLGEQTENSGDTSTGNVEVEDPYDLTKFDLPPVETSIDLELPVMHMSGAEARAAASQGVPEGFTAVDEGGDQEQGFGPGDYPDTSGPTMQAVSAQRDDDDGGPARPGVDWQEGIDFGQKEWTSSLTVLIRDWSWPATKSFSIFKEPGAQGQFGIKGGQKDLQLSLGVSFLDYVFPKIWGAGIEACINTQWAWTQTQQGNSQSPFGPTGGQGQATPQAELKLPKVDIASLVLQGPVIGSFDGKDGFDVKWGGTANFKIQFDFAQGAQKK